MVIQNIQFNAIVEKIYEIYANNLTQGNTTSCGCIKESHGEQKIREILSTNNINFISQKKI